MSSSRKRRAVEIESDSTKKTSVPTSATPVAAATSATTAGSVDVAAAEHSVDAGASSVVAVAPPSLIVHGRNVSGKPWKPTNREKKSALFKGNRALRSFEERQQLRAEDIAFKAKIDAIKKEAEAERDAERTRRAEKRRRKEENEKKNTVYEPITNIHKIRKMTKKQARNIVKVL